MSLVSVVLLLLGNVIYFQIIWKSLIFNRISPVDFSEIFTMI
jgi:hypothetical protein